MSPALIPDTLFDWTPSDVDRPSTFATTPLLVIRVLGTARPKGAMVPFVAPSGRARAREKRSHSTGWRSTVATTAYNSIRCECPNQDCVDLKPGYPHDGPVSVAIGLTFTPPKKPAWPWPATRTTGDLDKQARNCLDALVDAGVITDDARVVRLVVEKRYSTTGVAAAGIVVWPAAASSTQESPVLPGATLGSPPGSAGRHGCEAALERFCS